MTSNKKEKVNKSLVLIQEDKIYGYIVNTVKHCNRSVKPYKFYVNLVNLHKTKPDFVKQLISSIKDWGCFKEIFKILVVIKKDCNDIILEDFIYSYLISQLKDDILKYETNQPISYLAKWIPKQGHSFDKQLDFVTNICKRLYVNNKSNTKSIKPSSYRKKYRLLISKLNKRLDTTEIKLCSQDYKNINFTNVPALSYKKNFKTFINNKDSKDNLYNYTFSKYISYNFTDIFNLMFNMFKQSKLDDFNKNLIKDVTKLNLDAYIGYINKSNSINISNTNVILDLSKSMYDSNKISVCIGLCLVYNMLENSNNNIIVNCNEPYILDLKSKDMFENLETVIQNTAYYPTINFSKIDMLKLTNKDTLVISNLDKINRDNTKYWMFDEVIKSDKRDIRIKSNINIVKNIINKENKRVNIIFYIKIISVISLLFLLYKFFY